MRPARLSTHPITAEQFAEGLLPAVVPRERSFAKMAVHAGTATTVPQEANCLDQAGRTGRGHLAGVNSRWIPQVGRYRRPAWVAGRPSERTFAGFLIGAYCSEAAPAAAATAVYSLFS